MKIRILLVFLVVFLFGCEFIPDDGHNWTVCAKEDNGNGYIEYRIKETMKDEGDTVVQYFRIRLRGPEIPIGARVSFYEIQKN